MTKSGPITTVTVHEAKTHLSAKHRTGRLGFAASLANVVVREMKGRGFRLLAIDCEQGQRAGSLPGEHRDPWDRLLAAQARIEGLAVVTSDPKLAAFGVETVW